MFQTTTNTRENHIFQSFSSSTPRILKMPIPCSRQQTFSPLGHDSKWKYLQEKVNTFTRDIFHTSHTISGSRAIRTIAEQFQLLCKPHAHPFVTWGSNRRKIQQNFNVPNPSKQGNKFSILCLIALSIRAFIIKSTHFVPNKLSRKMQYKNEPFPSTLPETDKFSNHVTTSYYNGVFLFSVDSYQSPHHPGATFSNTFGENSASPK